MYVRILNLLFIAVFSSILGCQSSSSRDASHIVHDESHPHAEGVASTQGQRKVGHDPHTIKEGLEYLNDPTPVSSNTVVLTVHGLGCPLCAGNVDKQLLRVPGVMNVKVDLSAGATTVEVSPDTPPTRRALAKAIYESGFTLVSIDENPDTKPDDPSPSGSQDARD